MAALTDKEIIAALPDETRQKINNSFEALSQMRPSAEEQALLYRVAHTLKMQPTDVQFASMAALHYYLQLYQQIPGKIAKVGGEIRQAGKDVEGALRTATRETLTEHADVLKAQAALAVSEAQQSLIGEVGKIAQRIAGDATAAERHRLFAWAGAGVGLGVLVCAVLFGGAGYVIRMKTDAIDIATAQANEQTAKMETADAVTKAKASATVAIAAENARTEAEVKQLRASAGWLGTADSQLAYKFFMKGNGKSATTCDADLHWQKLKTEDGRNLCVPMRQGLFFGWASGETGWLIP